MIPSLKFHPKGLIALKHAWQHFFPGLDQAFCPSRLLGFEGCHLNGKFSRTLDVLQINEFPPLELCAIGETGVLGEGVVLPASSFLDSMAPPDPRGSIEVKKHIATRAPRMFQNKMTVEQNRLD